MPFSRLDRKVALLRIGKSHTEIAQECDVDRSTVSHVISGARWTGPDARKVMDYIAKLIGSPLEEVFPGSDRRQAGSDRRNPDQTAGAA